VVFLILEGINGSGKSALAAALMHAWRRTGGISAQTVDTVGHSTFGRQVRSAIMEARDLNPLAETLAFASARVHGLSRLRQETGDRTRHLCILERWSGAVTAYGQAAGIPAHILRTVSDLLQAAAEGIPQILVDTPGTIADARLATQPDLNRFETQGPNYLEKVRKAYLRWAGDCGARVVSGTDPPADIERLANELVATVAAPESRVEP
jgi:thymidylate kinase